MNDDMNDERIQQAAQAIHKAQKIAILTGAGVSKESGVPTFREAMDGLWAQYDPQQLATPQAFQANPKLVWDWYQWRRGLVSNAQPNPGHIALAKLHEYKRDVVVITQNVDDLHEQAGSQQIIHLHGNIARSRCYDNCQDVPTSIDISQLDYDKENGPPTCPHCGAYVRPDVVWFGEPLPQAELANAFSISEACDVMLVVGTSGLVSPASQLPILAKRNGATIIEVNPDYSMITRIADIKLEGPSGEMLPRVVAALGR